MGYSDFLDYTNEIAHEHVAMHRKQEGVCDHFRPLGYGGAGSSCLGCAYFNSKNCGVSSAGTTRFAYFG